MKNLSSYCGLVDASISASEKDLLVAFAVANSSFVVHLAGTDHKFLPDFSWNKTDDGFEVTEEDMELVNSY